MNTHSNPGTRLAAAAALALGMTVLGGASALAQDCQPSTDSYSTEGAPQEGPNGGQPENQQSEDPYRAENTC
ncbi:hypothetical protein NN3_47110 [Nocardia neocaledoniensis NBRC 108232]|uniref:Uncharacterized protein n=1 Tax=Nocardia neocaledoniensis TaxID=236511 RepID=A0A317N5K1_9NOCA|nr:hypothetical protein [Nocardia neocaledoniensis]PWV70293.1 hypothetical protein DFR69_1136 [Nocardia neocaledoniensis]GEM33704.1 hypothetical protein NN3_47110 [Nocardia neocaledoniensis NBRC 108232]